MSIGKIEFFSRIEEEEEEQTSHTWPEPFQTLGLGSHQGKLEVYSLV